MSQQAKGRKFYCPATNESVQGYKNYLKTRWWASLRQMYRKSHEPECAVCGKTTDLALHHRTYSTVGQETMKDLILLCSGCHTKVHQLTDHSVKFMDICFAVEKLKYDMRSVRLLRLKRRKKV